MGKFKVIHGACKGLHRAKHYKSPKAAIARARSTLRQVEHLRDYLVQDMKSGKATTEEVERFEVTLDNGAAKLKEFIRAVESRLA